MPKVERPKDWPKQPIDFDEIFEFMGSANPFAIMICEIVTIFLQKRHDYSGEGAEAGGDDYKNFRACEAMGIEAWVVPIMRITEKLGRVHNYILQRRLKVSGESVTDTLQDIANLAVISAVLLNEGPINEDGQSPQYKLKRDEPTKDPMDTPPFKMQNSKGEFV